MKRPSRRSKGLALGILTILGVLLVPFVLSAAALTAPREPMRWGTPTTFFATSGDQSTLPTRPSLRILYASDWSGRGEVYAVDTKKGSVDAQLTHASSGCDYGDPLPSPNGKHLLLSYRCDDREGRRSASLFVAAPNGMHRRRLAYSPDCYRCGTAAWAPDSRRIAYLSDVGVRVVRVDGSHDRVLGGGSSSFDLRWSPDGSSLAFLSQEVGGSLLVWGKGLLRTVASADAFAWDPRGKRIAYDDSSAWPGRLFLVAADGSSRRQLSDGYGLDLAWSPDGRFLAYDGRDGPSLVDIQSDAIRPLRIVLGSSYAWAPKGHELAVSVYGQGIDLVDGDSGAVRQLTSTPRTEELDWSPDGKELAFIPHGEAVTDRGSHFPRSDLRLVDLAGNVQTLVAAAGDHGGYMYGLAWTRPPAHLRYRKPASRTIATVSRNQLIAPWEITRLTADGNRVAYVSCGHVFVWTPTSGEVVQAEPAASLSVRCTIAGDYVAYSVYNLALAGERVAFGVVEGNSGQDWGLYSGTLGRSQRWAQLDLRGFANGCSVGTQGLGELVGSGTALVFSRWIDDNRCPATTLEQEIDRVPPDGCPCPVIADSPGPLVPFDADHGRIAVGGENATELLGEQGTQLLSLPVSPLAAQLSGADLVLLVQGALRDYDAAKGTLLHVWPLPDVPSGGECGSPHSAAWECHRPRLLLEDVARGLVTYVLDGKVHLLRLSDGTDLTVAAGTLARFMDAGLVYVDGARLHLVPFASLGQRSLY